jgi:hypothetical protein
MGSGQVTPRNIRVRAAAASLSSLSGTAPRLRVSIVRALFIHCVRKKIREPLGWVVRNDSRRRMGAEQPGVDGLVRHSAGGGQLLVNGVGS